jgi:hypothetical protein
MTGGLVMSTSFALLVVTEEEDDEDDGDVITLVALSTNPVIEAKSATIPSSITSVLLTFVVGRGTRGLMLSVLNGFRAGCCGAGGG